MARRRYSHLTMSHNLLGADHSSFLLLGWLVGELNSYKSTPPYPPGAGRRLDRAVLPTRPGTITWSDLGRRALGFPSAGLVTGSAVRSW